MVNLPCRHSLPPPADSIMCVTKKCNPYFTQLYFFKNIFSLLVLSIFMMEWIRWQREWNWVHIVMQTNFYDKIKYYQLQQSEFSVLFGINQYADLQCKLFSWSILCSQKWTASFLVHVHLKVFFHYFVTFKIFLHLSVW